MQLTKLREKFNLKVFSSKTSDVDTGVIDDYINQGYQAFLIKVLEVNGNWQVNGNFATTDIIAEQRNYAFNSNLLKLKEVYIKSTSTGEYIKAKQRDVKTIQTDPLTNYRPSTPEFDLSDNLIYIYTPEETIEAVTAGIKIFFEEEYTALVNTTDEPKMPVFAQPYLWFFAAREYCEDNEMWNKTKRFDARLAELDTKIETYYSSRDTQDKQVVMEMEEFNYT